MRQVLEAYMAVPPSERWRSVWTVDKATLNELIDAWLERGDDGRCPVESTPYGLTLLGLPLVHPEDGVRCMTLGPSTG